MRSMIDITPEAMQDILPMLASVVRVVGSAVSPYPEMVRLTLEGDVLPDCDQVTCAISKTIGKGKAIIEFNFNPDEDRKERAAA